MILRFPPYNYRIYARWHKQLLDLAREQGKELYPSDLINDEPVSAPVTSSSTPLAKWPGTLVIGSVELPVYVLSEQIVFDGM
jgi:hypothetical protein